MGCWERPKLVVLAERLPDDDPAKQVGHRLSLPLVPGCRRFILLLLLNLGDLFLCILLLHAEDGRGDASRSHVGCHGNI